MTSLTGKTAQTLEGTVSPPSISAALLGATLQLVPSHCDPTVNLHDFFVGVRGGLVETLFEIDARGPG